jgi:hypothetical protein
MTCFDATAFDPLERVDLCRLMESQRSGLDAGAGFMTAAREGRGLQDAFLLREFDNPLPGDVRPTSRRREYRRARATGRRQIWPTDRWR